MFTIVYFTQLLRKLFVYALVSIQCWISLRSTLSRKHRVKWKKRSWHHDNSSENSVKFRWSSYGFDGCSVDRNHLFVLTFILLYPFFSAVSPWSRTAWGREVHSTLVVTHASEHWVKRKRWSSHHGNPQETLFSISMMNIFYLMLLDSQIQFYPFWPNCFAVSQRTIQLLMTQHWVLKTSHRSGQEDLFGDKQDSWKQTVSKETREYHLPMTFYAKPARASYFCGQNFLSKEWKPGWWAPQGLVFLFNNCQRGRRRGETASSHAKSMIFPPYGPNSFRKRVADRTHNDSLMLEKWNRTHRVKWKKRYWHHDNVWANICL